MRDIDGRAGPLGKLHMARNKIGVRMRFKDSHNLQPFSFGGRKIIIDVAFRIDDRGLAGISDQVRGVREALNVEPLLEHTVAMA